MLQLKSITHKTVFVLNYCNDCELSNFSLLKGKVCSRIFVTQTTK